MLFGLWWTLTHGDNAKVPFERGFAFWPVARAMLGSTWYSIQGEIGIFGFLAGFCSCGDLPDLDWCGDHATDLGLRAGRAQGTGRRPGHAAGRSVHPGSGPSRTSETHRYGLARPLSARLRRGPADFWPEFW